jgi:hypothetical protein
MVAGAVAAVLVLGLCRATPAGAQDLDRDGLDDGLEQALLEGFLPTFVLSADECDGLPASLVTGRGDPVVATRDGTIYGHVARRSPPGATPIDLELKFFHLWGRDCGRPSHALDVERVAALVRAPSLHTPAGEWTALYWYAAAHEGTVCDASSGGAAEAVRANNRGPYVYVSRGKHASYLQRGQCKWGCGSDLCDPGSPVPRAGVVNLGELDAPLNGAAWIGSSRWNLAAKLGPDFDPARRSRFDRRPAAVLALKVPLRPYQAPILGGDTGLDALITAGEATADAVGTALARTVRGVATFLRAPMAGRQATQAASLATSVPTAQQLAFLASARVIASRPIGKGITGALRLTLSDGQLTHDASFQSVDEKSSDQDIREGRLRAGELRFVDSYRYNIAAWEMARLLGLDGMMPATVERRHQGKVGALSWWVDNVLMDEAERERTDAQPADGALALVRQRQRMQVFAELLYDTDRNKGNVVYTRDWRVVMLDFTRAFRTQQTLRTPQTLTTCDRQLLARLRTLTEQDVARATGRQLTPEERRALMARRTLIVAHFDRLIAERGEGTVLY